MPQIEWLRCAAGSPGVAGSYGVWPPLWVALAIVSSPRSWTMLAARAPGA
jgi:hypothetical protein